MSMEWCRDILSDAIGAEGQTEKFNTDQGSQFTSPNFVNPLLDKGIKVSMRTPRGMEKEEHLTMFLSNVFGGRLNKHTWNSITASANTLALDISPMTGSLEQKHPN